MFSYFVLKDKKEELANTRRTTKEIASKPFFS